MCSNKPKIVIVDDDRLNLEIIKSALEDMYEIHPVSDEMSALEIFEDVMPDLIIMDIMMPQIDGVSIFIAQRQNPRIEHIPVMFVSAIGDEEYKEQLLDWGIKDYITKPYDINDIRAKITHHLLSKRV